MSKYYETLSVLLQRPIRVFSDIGDDPRLYEKVARYTNVDIITTIVYRGSAKPHMIGYDAFLAHAAKPKFTLAVNSTKTYLTGKLSLRETEYFPRMFAGSTQRMTRPHRRRFVTFAYMCKRRGLNRDMRKLLSTFLLNLEVDKIVLSYYYPSRITGKMSFKVCENLALGDISIRAYDYEQAFLTLLWIRFRSTGKRPVYHRYFSNNDILLFGDYFIHLFKQYQSRCMDILMGSNHRKSIGRMFELFGKTHPELCAYIEQELN